MKHLCLILFALYVALGAQNSNDFIKKARDAYEKSDFDDAKLYYSKACKQGNMLGCSGLGTLYERGLGVDQSYKKAKQYYDFACKKGDSFGCFHARLFEIGPKAEEYYEAMCDDSDGLSCLRLADLYYKGLGVSKNYQNAAYYYQRACSFFNAEGCFNLGIIYENGKGKLKQSTEIALAYFYLAKNYFEKECQEGNASSCNILNNIEFLQD